MTAHSALAQRLGRLSFLAVVFSAFLSAQVLSPDVREILRLQDQRSLGDGRLVGYLQGADPAVRYRAAIALANIQDTSTSIAVIPLLRDPDSAVRSAAAFALGQIGSPVGVRELLNALATETDPQAQVRIIEALGKTGNEGALDSLCQSADRIPFRVRPALGIAIARFAMRGIGNERSVWFCFDLLKDSSPAVRAAALYALWRASPRGIIDVEVSKRRELLRRLVKDGSADVRVNVATLLGRVRTGDARDLLQSFARHERTGGNWRVNVQLVRALGATAVGDADVLKDLILYLDDPNEHVKVSTLDVLSNLPTDVLADYSGRVALRAKLHALATGEGVPEPVRGESLVALARHFPLSPASAADFCRGTCSARIRAKFLEALSLQPTKENLAFVLASLTDDTIRVSMAGWDFLRRAVGGEGAYIGKNDTSSSHAIAQTIENQAELSLHRRDPGITTVVANALGDSSVFTLLRQYALDRRAVDTLRGACRACTGPADVEAKQAILSAFGKIGAPEVIPLLTHSLDDSDRTVASEAAASLFRITGKSYTDRLRPSTIPAYVDYDWDELERARSHNRVTVHTTKGNFVVELYPDDAPFTVLSFLKLVKKKFYDGLTFHRVVPNFVIQGGDPRGDGWGGAGYAIRSEFSLRNFERGSCGLASAGKDTEGSQFFVTHQATPHLDGRYTVFGGVVSGMDVVDRIQPGDIIISILPRK